VFERWREYWNQLQENAPDYSEVSAQEWKLLAIAWVLTLVAFPLATHGSGVFAGAAWGLLVGLWIAGCYYSIKEHGKIQVIEYE